MYQYKIIDGKNEEIMNHLSEMLNGVFTAQFKPIWLRHEYKDSLGTEKQEDFDKLEHDIRVKAFELMDVVQDFCGLYGLKYYPYDEMIFRWADEPFNGNNEYSLDEKGWSMEHFDRHDYRVHKFFLPDGSVNKVNLTEEDEVPYQPPPGQMQFNWGKDE